MTETTLFIIEAFVGGVVLGAIIITFLWAWDTKDRIKSQAREKADEYGRGWEAGYIEGGRMRFLERCQIARRCRQLEKQIGELQDDQETQV